MEPVVWSYKTSQNQKTAGLAQEINIIIRLNLTWKNIKIKAKIVIYQVNFKAELGKPPGGGGR